MQFDLVSDFHSDLWNTGTNFSWAKYRNEGSDVLVLAGDTSNYMNDIPVIINRALNVYKHVIFTDGNHEHYAFDRVADVDDICEELQEFADSKENVTFLTGRNSVQVNNTVFIGCNGWYDFRVYEDRFNIDDSMNAWKRMSNDSKMIDFAMVPVAIRAKNQAALIEQQVADLQDSDMELVVVTHTIPTKVLSKWSPFSTSPNAIIECAYYNTAMENAYFADIKQKIKVWVYGHTHVRSERKIGHVRYINNARGYESESTSRWFIAQIDTEDQGYGDDNE